MDQSEQAEREPEEVHYCHWHQTEEARLYCGRCGKFVCLKCTVPAQVGIRCRECGKPTRIPTYDVRPTYYARAVGVALAVAICGGLLLALFPYIFGTIPFFPSLAAIGIGYGAGELISGAVNGKRGAGLAWITGCSVVGAFLIGSLFDSFTFGILGLLFLGFGVYAAVQRVR